MPIADWPQEDCPRERLLACGAKSLSNGELLAVFPRVGIKGKAAFNPGRGRITQFGSRRRLFAAPSNDFARISGMGPATFAQWQAVLELARRAIREEQQVEASFTSPTAVSKYLRLRLQAREAHTLAAVFMDAQHRLIAAEDRLYGPLTQTALSPREVA